MLAGLMMMNGQMNHPSAQEIGADARWLAQALDPHRGLVRLVEMDRDRYRAASFLDDRLLLEASHSLVLEWSKVAEGIDATSRQDARWIFHIGHVGSTLIARLLGDLPNILSVREPRIVRDLAMLSADARVPYLANVRSLLSRTFSQDEHALVKVTSFASEIAAELIPSDGSALFLFAQPRTYVETILAGPNSRKELRALASSRAERLKGRGVETPWSTKSEAHLATAAWLCEMTSLECAANAVSGVTILWRDFDGLLNNLWGEFQELVTGLGFRPDPEGMRAVLSGPLLTRYSKAPEYEYSASLRSELLAEAGTLHRADIDDAMQRLEDARNTFPIVDDVLLRAQQEV